MNRNTIVKWEKDITPLPKIAGWAMLGLLASEQLPLRVRG